MPSPPTFRRRLQSPAVAVVGLAAVGLALLDLREQLFGIVPYVLLLACPALHLVMKHGERRPRRQRGDPHAGD